MQKNKFISWNDDRDYSLVSGGLIYSMLWKLGIYKDGQKRMLLRALIFAVFSWVPLIILSLTDGTFSGEDGRLGVTQDFLLHIRLLVVVPFLIWIERLIDPAFNDYMNSTRRLIPVDDEPDFKKIERQTDNMSKSWIPEILFLLLIYGLSIIKWNQSTPLESSLLVTDSASNINLSAVYYLFVSVPIYQFLLIRWFWRWIIWAITALKFSKMNLRIEASHADQMAGMAYLSLVPIAYCVMSMAFSIIFSATIAQEIIYRGSKAIDYIIPIIVFSVSLPLFIHLPLLAFIPIMIRTKVRTITRFGSLIQYHNNLYREKWMEGMLPDNELILPSPDNSSMADINGSYLQSINGMSIIPINRNTFILSVVMIFIPFIPLVFTMYSINELFSKLVQIIGG